MAAFRFFIICVALATALCFFVSGTLLMPAERNLKRDRRAFEPKDSTELSHSGLTTPLSFLRQAVGQRNFVLLLGLGLLQVFNCHFNSNVLALLLKQFLSGFTMIQSLALAGSFVIPHLCVALLSPLVQKRGNYDVITYLLAGRVAIGFAGVSVLSPTGPLLVGVFLLCNKVITEVVCRHSSLLVTDAIDEDTGKHHRPAPLSTMFFGTYVDYHPFLHDLFELLLLQLWSVLSARSVSRPHARMAYVRELRLATSIAAGGNGLRACGGSVAAGNETCGFSFVAVFFSSTHLLCALCSLRCGGFTPLAGRQAHSQFDCCRSDPNVTTSTRPCPWLRRKNAYNSRLQAQNRSFCTRHAIRRRTARPAEAPSIPMS
jgi:hypothetical protein